MARNSEMVPISDERMNEVTLYPRTPAPTCCGVKKQTCLLVGTLLALLMMIRGVMDGVVSVLTPVPSMDDPLLEELILLNATFEKGLSQFSGRKSPQSQALAWMKRDPIVMSPGRSTRDLLQRYVLAVLFYSTDGLNWDWSLPFHLSSDDVCSWNRRLWSVLSAERQINR